MEEQKHTPLPWEVFGNIIWKTGPDGAAVAILAEPEAATSGDVKPYGFLESSRRAEAVANRDFILRACNSHYELVEAVKRLVAKAEAEYGPCLKNEPENCDVCYARAALAKATGGAK